MRVWRIDSPNAADVARDDGYWYISCDWVIAGRADTAEFAEFIVDACNEMEWELAPEGTTRVIGTFQRPSRRGTG